jgi:predicted Zn-dependent peptidase
MHRRLSPVCRQGSDQSGTAQKGTYTIFAENSALSTPITVDFEMMTLPNGIRVIHKQVHNSKIAHCGFILDIGSRDERPEQQGLAHFWEHMAFKGTKKRKAYHILNRIDSVGGELNAYTTKEKICFYASLLSAHFEKALDLLTDITFHSIFPENQIERERNVILEEMALYEDNPEDAIQDEFDQTLFPGHPLGYNILGTRSSIRTFHRSDFELFIRRNLRSEGLIFSSVSDLPAGKVFRQAERYLGQLGAYHGKTERGAAGPYVPKSRVVKKPITQCHCAIGRPGFALDDPKRLHLLFLTNLLGGPAMNSRLNLSLREQHGLVYNIEASYTPYSDTGLFGIYFGTEKRRLHRSVDLVLRELAKLRMKPLSSLQLHRAIEQFIGQMAMSEENNISLMLMMGKSMLDLDRIDSFETVVEQVRSIQSGELLDLAREFFKEDQLSFLYFIPRNRD